MVKYNFAYIWILVDRKIDLEINLIALIRSATSKRLTCILYMNTYKTQTRELYIWKMARNLLK